MAGIITRRKKDKNFVILDKTCLLDQNISFKAKGLHSYLMQLPDDWNVNISDLTNRSKDGRDSVTTAMNELIKAGYVSRELSKSDKGLLAGYDYIMYETPQPINGLSVYGKSVNGLSVNGKSTTNKDYCNKVLLDEELVIDSEKNNSINNSIIQNENTASNTPKQPPLKEEEKQNVRESANVAPAAAAPKLPSAWVEIIQKAGPRTPRKMQYSSERVFQIETPQEIAEALMLAGKDQMFADQIKRRCGLLPEDTITHIFTAYLENHISVCGEGYQNVKQFRYHLLNFGPKYLSARKAEPQQKPQQSRIPTYG